MGNNNVNEILRNLENDHPILKGNQTWIMARTIEDTYKVPSEIADEVEFLYNSKLLLKLMEEDRPIVSGNHTWYMTETIEMTYKVSKRMAEKVTDEYNSKILSKQMEEKYSIDNIMTILSDDVEKQFNAPKEIAKKATVDFAAKIIANQMELIHPINGIETNKIHPIVIVETFGVNYETAKLAADKYNEKILSFSREM